MWSVIWSGVQLRQRFWDTTSFFNTDGMWVCVVDFISCVGYLGAVGVLLCLHLWLSVRVFVVLCGFLIKSRQILESEMCIRFQIVPIMVDNFINPVGRIMIFCKFY